MKVSKTIGDQTMAEDSSSLVMKRRRLAHVANPDAVRVQINNKSGYIWDYALSEPLIS